MRILKANNTPLDIDDETAIGIDYQAYDFKKAGDIKVNVSNTFTVPATSKNLKIFGFAGRAYSLSAVEYEKILIDYYIRNTQFITKGVARVEKIEGGRIHLFVAERPAFIDEMKTTDLTSFLSHWFDNAFTNTQFNTFFDFLSSVRLGVNGVVLPLINGNLSLYEDRLGATPEKIGYYSGTTVGGTEYSNTIAMSVQNDNTGTIAMGGHFFVYIDRLLKHIETYFNVDLSRALSGDYNIFNDSLIEELSIPVRNILYATPSDKFALAFIDNIGATYSFLPHEDLNPYEGLTVYDFFTTTLRLLGYAIEPMPDGKYEIIRLDLINLVNTKSDFLPGYMAEGFKDMTYIPNIESYGVNNIIKMKPYSEGGETLGSKTIVSTNKNLDERKDLFKVDAYIPPFLISQGDFVPDMSASDSFKNITYFKKTNTFSLCRITGRWQVLTDITLDDIFPPRFSWPGELEIPTEDETMTLMIPEVYTVANEYTFLDNILQSPETRKVKRWVNSSMMEGFRKIAVYYVREFGAWYFVNKISNFNPDKSNEPVEFELMKMPWARYPELPNKEIISTDEWILENGIWNDSGIWIDTEIWID